MNIKIQEELYAIRDVNGRWFRRGSRAQWRGGSWTEDFSQASVWPKASIPRSIISRYSNKRPIKEMPYLATLRIREVELTQEKDKAIKARKRLKTKCLAKEKRYREYLIGEIARNSAYPKSEAAIRAENALVKLDSGELNHYYRPYLEIEKKG